MHPVPAGYPIAQLSGALIVSFLLNWAFFGTLSVQLYLYYLAFPNDKTFIKFLVYGIYVIEIVQTMLAIHDAFATFGYGFGDIDTLTRSNFNWLAVPIMSTVVACIGQVFYAYRIFIVSKSRIIPIFVICISLTSSVAATITGVYSFRAGELTRMSSQKTYITAGIWCGASALCDILIAICMTYYLMRRTTSFRRTRILVTKIIRLTIETGSVTAVVALLAFILFVAFPHEPYHTAAALVLPYLYANAVYMVLNSRFEIIGGRGTYESSSITTMVIGNMISSPSIDDTGPAEGTPGQAPVVILSSEVFKNDKLRDGCMGVFT
ncbi:hypothetical protein IW261DRAFT_1605035 [Armillaria novae-zelandiae]|uniref:DUF6534 domain-containing protein n=1 Tax=Armillaria novae-zelandiae TaxID=153914 RepID=A0AA39UJ37_9AGAR|nr:hypothetical protein IW261DRAFT_1605035 [Armillaria novae-zelandiae]